MAERSYSALEGFVFIVILPDPHVGVRMPLVSPLPRRGSTVMPSGTTATAAPGGFQTKFSGFRLGKSWLWFRSLSFKSFKVVGKWTCLGTTNITWPHFSLSINSFCLSHLLHLGDIKQNTLKDGKTLEPNENCRPPICVADTYLKIIDYTGGF